MRGKICSAILLMLKKTTIFMHTRRTHQQWCSSSGRDVSCNHRMHASHASSSAATTELTDINENARLNVYNSREYSRKRSAILS
jgi:hypothetical protein